MSRTVLIASISLVLTFTGCYRPKSSGKRYEDYPAFQEGGTMSLTLDGAPYTVRLQDIEFANTDEGYPDFVEINGMGTRIIIEYAPKDIDFDSDDAYNKIINVPLTIKTLDIDDKPMTVSFPELGVFTVTGGVLTLQKGTVGRDGRDWWDGLITLTLDSPDGPKTASGTFAWCIVPIW